MSVHAASLVASVLAAGLAVSCATPSAPALMRWADYGKRSVRRRYLTELPGRGQPAG